MARRIQPIFDSILADARITGSERSFVEDLANFYKRTKRLSPGRRRCLLEIEERLKAAPSSIDPAMDSRLTNLLSRATEAKDHWALNFIPSLKGQLLAGRALSARQMEILAKVEARHSDEAKAERDSWASSFTSEMREKMEIAARYYLEKPPYFEDLVRKVLDDNTFIPSKRAYKKMVENNYATKVIESTLSEPKFKPGSHVALRANAGRLAVHGLLHRVRCRGTTGIVLKAGAKPVTSAARGSKVYSVLFFGQTTPHFIEERWLKKGKR
jgi:hypothetical protein